MVIIFYLEERKNKWQIINKQKKWKIYKLMRVQSLIQIYWHLIWNAKYCDIFICFFFYLSLSRSLSLHVCEVSINSFCIWHKNKNVKNLKIKSVSTGSNHFELTIPLYFFFVSFRAFWCFQCQRLEDLFSYSKSCWYWTGDYNIRTRNRRIHI